MSGCCSDIGRINGASTSEAVIDHVAPLPTRGTARNTILVRGGRTFVGTHEPVIIVDGEGPERGITLGDFLMEAETVTNARFADFVAATGHVTEAERFGCSAVFAGLLQDKGLVTAGVSTTPWWARVDGASWKMPEGAISTINKRMDHPVTHVSWNDATAFAAWAGGRLPTEAEWEHAARGGNQRRRYPWGDAEPGDDEIFCNIWQGDFPHRNTAADGYYGTAPARSFAPTADGFYNLAGNVWEWTSDSFRVRSMSTRAKLRNEESRKNADKVLKGGSFLCHKSYCYRYRIPARMGLSPDSAASNVGFRVVYDA